MMRKPYRTIEDVLRSPWAAIERPGEGVTTDRVLRSTRLEDSIYADLRDGDNVLEQTEGEAAKKLPSFPALSRDVFQSFYSLMPRKNGEDMLSTAARKFNAPILEHITQSGDYLSVLNESGGRARHEKRFLIESLGALALGGLLAYVIPYYRLTPDICRVLSDNFENLGLWRFTDAEFKKFKQVAVLGTRKKRDEAPQNTQWLEWFAAHPGSIPSLTELPEGRYALPAKPLEVKTFRGEKFNEKELERQLSGSDSFQRMMARSELDSGVKRPPLPLSISQIGLIGGSGMINGLIQCDTPHVIKGRVVKVTRNEVEKRFDAKGRYDGAEFHETITNKMIFNILTPNGFKALT